MPPLFILVGPSGAGKTSVLERLLAMSDLPLHRALTTTTRPPRPGEANGKDYWFVTREKFKEMIEAGDFLEWVENYGWRYGTSRAEIARGLASGKPVILITDMKGARNIRRQMTDTLVIFLDAPREQLIERIRPRSKDAADLESRIRKFDVEQTSSAHADVIVENADGRLDQTVAAVADLIRSRYHP